MTTSWIFIWLTFDVGPVNFTSIVEQAHSHLIDSFTDFLITTTDHLCINIDLGSYSFTGNHNNGYNGLSRLTCNFSIESNELVVYGFFEFIACFVDDVQIVRIEVSVIQDYTTVVQVGKRRHVMHLAPCPITQVGTCPV
ncbi:hypothetical protein D3C87_1184770 [compost metagenome]